VPTADDYKPENYGHFDKTLAATIASLSKDGRLVFQRIVADDPLLKAGPGATGLPQERLHAAFRELDEAGLIRALPGTTEVYVPKKVLDAQLWETRMEQIRENPPSYIVSLVGKRPEAEAAQGPWDEAALAVEQFRTRFNVRGSVHGPMGASANSGEAPVRVHIWNLVRVSQAATREARTASGRDGGGLAGK
jgi:hypothetical protein